MVARRSMPCCMRVASHVHEGTPAGRGGNSDAHHYFVEPSQLIRPPLPRPPAVDFTKTVQQPSAPATSHQGTSSWSNTPSMFHSNGTRNHAATLYSQPLWSPHVTYSYPYAHAHYTHPPHSNHYQHYSQAQPYEAGQAQFYHEQWHTQRPAYYSVPPVGEGANAPQHHSSSKSVSTSRRAGPPLPFGHIGHVYRFWDEMKARLAALMPIKRVPVLVPPSTQTHKKAVKGEADGRRFVEADGARANSEKSSSSSKTTRVPNSWIRPDSYASLLLSRFGFTPRVRERIVVNYKELMWDFGPFVLAVIFIFPDILEGCFADWYRWGARDNYRESKKK